MNTYNRKRILKRAHYLAKDVAYMYSTYSEALSIGLKKAWNETKAFAAKKIEEAKQEAEKQLRELRWSYDVSPLPNYEMNKAALRGTNLNTLGI